MSTNYRVLAVGGERPVLVGLDRAFQAAGATFAVAADPARLVESALRFAPHLFLVFARPSPEEAMRSVAALRAEPRFAAVPVVLVASLPPTTTRGVNLVVPDPSDVGELAGRLVRVMRTSFPAAPAEFPEIEFDEILEVEDFEPSPARLLLVDDDPSLIRLFSLALRKARFEVSSAEDGVRGLAAVLELRPDLIVADLNMPNLDGWGLLRALRADHRVGETPVIFLSCHDDYRENLRALSAGAQDYLAKGGKLEALVGRVRALLAPRDAFLSALRAEEKVAAKIGELGIQWSLRQVAALRCSGTVQVRDAFWSAFGGLREGRLVCAAAQIGGHALTGPAALAALVALRSGDFFHDPAGPVPEENLEGPLADLLEAAARQNNRSEAAALDKLMTLATKVEVDGQLFELYERLCSSRSREVATMVRQGLTPREVISRCESSPLEVEDTLRDLVRRRVLRINV